ncbi:ABC transporter permease [Paenibacillus sanguinis]|uniref:ABC transporter permease n=1 Tax=Paenibacillus sanguinis TaxID=225906 RepID=UPI00037BB577|nr:ABC transporter permease [Paenibacillus sanguinis]
MHKMGTVIAFTFMNKVKTKSFVITTLVLALLVSVGLHVPYFIDRFTHAGETAPQQIGLVYNEQAELAKSLQVYLEKQSAQDYKLLPYEAADETMLHQAVQSGEIDGYLMFAQGTEDSFPAITYTSKSGTISPGLQATLQAALQNVKTEYLTRGMLSEKQLAALNAPVQLGVAQVSTSAAQAEGEKAGEFNYVLVYVLIILFFMTITMTGNMISAEVTAEKSSRIMEILITSVSPLAQMFGKIIGMFYIGLLQIGIFAGVIALNIALPYNRLVLADFNLDVSDIQIEVLILGFIFYILGYFLYATLFAAIGSLVSRTEELGQAIMPITMLTLAAFYIGIFSLSMPNSLLMKVSSYIPFVSPVSMIVRVGLGTPPIWEIVLSLVILVIAILAFGWLSAKIYRTGVLLYGKRPTFKELRKAMKAYKM